MPKKLFLVWFLSIFISACFLPDFCENTVEKEVISPNGNFKAVIFDRGCGATVGFITGISIIPANEKIQNDDTGNILFAENVFREFSVDASGKVQYGKTNFDVEWINDEELLVYYTQSKGIRQAKNYKNTKISYKLISE